MNYYNLNTPAFGSRFSIKKLAIGNVVTASGRMGAMYEYSTRKLSKCENFVNTIMNKKIENLINKLVKKFSKAYKVEISEQYNKGLMIKEYIIDVSDEIDDVVEAKINALKKKKLLGYLFNFPKLSTCKFERQ